MILESNFETKMRPKFKGGSGWWELGAVDKHGVLCGDRGWCWYDPTLYPKSKARLLGRKGKSLRDHRKPRKVV